MPSPPPVRGRLYVALAVAVSFVTALVVGVLRFVLSTEAEHGTRVLSSIAVAAIVAAPGAIGLLASRRRDSGLLLAAAGSAVVAVFVSFGPTVPLAASAALFLLGYRPATLVRDVIALAAAVVALAAAIAALQLTTDPRSVTTAAGQEGVSDVITTAEATASLALTLLCVVLSYAVVWASGRRQRQPEALG